MLVVAGATSATAWLMKPAVNGVFAQGESHTLALLSLAFPLVFIAKGLANYGQRTLMNLVGARIIARCRSALFDHLAGMDIGFFARQPTATLVSRFTVDLTVLKTTITTATMALGRDAATLAGLLVTLVLLDPRLALIAAALFPLAGLPILLLGRTARRAARGMQAESGRLDALLVQVFQGIREVKVALAQDREKARVATTVDHITRHMLRTERTGAAVSMVLEILSGIAVAAVVVYGGGQVTAGALDPGTFFAFLAALFLLYQPIKRLGRVHVVAQEGLAAAERYYALLDTRPALTDPPNAPALVVSEGAVRFEDVRLSYPGGGAPALEGLSFIAPAGCTTALVGPSGAGKSTTLALIPRFLDPDAGRVLIDGQDLRGVAQRSLWRQIALVTQEVILFDDTLGANIAYGRPDATEAEIRAAASAAALDDLIDGLPQGLATPIGEEGQHLSGGQRQRVMLARAFLKDAPILLLDEATSALDTDSERRIRAAFDRLRQGRTCLVVAHRLATVRDADVIHVMEAGRIVESGTHAALLARGGLYARLCATDLAAAPSPPR